VNRKDFYSLQFKLWFEPMFYSNVFTQTPLLKRQQKDWPLILNKWTWHVKSRKHILFNIHTWYISCMQQPREDFPNRDLHGETQLGLSLDEEECKNSMQSSTALARYDESLGSDSERDLTKVDEETFLEDLLLIETTLMEFATFSPSRSRNLTGDSKGSLDILEKLQLPMTLFLFPNTLCLRNMVGFSLTSGLKLTLLLFLNIFDEQYETSNCRKSQYFNFLLSGREERQRTSSC